MINLNRDRLLVDYNYRLILVDILSLNRYSLYHG